MLYAWIGGCRFSLGLLLCLSFGVACIAQPAPPLNVTAWPLRIDSAQGQIVVYQPQPEKFVDDKLSARAAVSIMKPPATQPVFGAMWMDARVATDRAARTVSILDVDIKRFRFPNSPDDQQTELMNVLKQQIPQMNVTCSLDELMTSLSVAQQEKVAAEQLQTTPPKIIVTTNPAVLVTLDGAPQLQATDQAQVMRVVNTPFVMMFDEASKQYFLKAGDEWMNAGEVTGPYAASVLVPSGVISAASKLAPPPNDENAGAEPQPPVNGPPPQIIVAEEPTELINSDGPPTYTPLPGNDLLYMSNTQSDVFMEVATQQYYVLLSGRWYRSASLANGPWEYVSSDKLPGAFAKIGPDSPKAHVLASIAGTMQAKDARLDARIPQTAAIARNAGQDLSVPYDGDPQFEPVAGSEVAYCTNTPYAVLRVHNRFYCCNSAVWYEAGAAAGPWSVCLSVPQVIYTLPPSCPDYYVRYCYVYDSTPGLVYCGYLPGYTGCFIFGPTIVFGTGYYYHGWFAHHYYARPCTWGFGVRYDHRIGAWAFGAGRRWDSRWLALGGVEHGWWGPRGFVDYHRLPHVIGGKYDAGREGYMNRLNVYNRVGRERRDEIVRRAEPVVREPARTEVRREEPALRNDVYADHNGDVYRRSDQGWERNTDRGWSHVNGAPLEREPEPRHVETPARTEEPRRVEEQPAARAPERHFEAPSESGLEAERADRERGEARANDFHSAGGESHGGGGGGEARPGGGHR
jgi:hypothetical protein